MINMETYTASCGEFEFGKEGESSLCMLDGYLFRSIGQRGCESAPEDMVGQSTGQTLKRRASIIGAAELV